MGSKLALRCAAVMLLLVLDACAGYRPGTDGTRPTLVQNQPSNAQPQPAGSLPR